MSGGAAIEVGHLALRSLPQSLCRIVWVGCHVHSGAQQARVAGAASRIQAGSPLCWTCTSAAEGRPCQRLVHISGRPCSLPGQPALPPASTASCPSTSPARVSRAPEVVQSCRRLAARWQLTAAFSSLTAGSKLLCSSPIPIPAAHRQARHLKVAQQQGDGSAGIGQEVKGTCAGGGGGRCWRRFQWRCQGWACEGGRRLRALFVSDARSPAAALLDIHS